MSTKSSPWNDAGFSTMELIRLVSREHHDKLSKSELPVLKILIEDAGYDATAVVSAATIAERVKVSRKTVLRALRGLTEKKYIESTRTRGAATYSLNVEKIMRGQNKRGQIDVKSGHQGPQEGTKQTVRGDTRDHSIESLRDSERVLESAHASVLPANWQDDYVNWFTYTPEQRRELIRELNKEHRRESPSENEYNHRFCAAVGGMTETRLRIPVKMNTDSGGM